MNAAVLHAHAETVGGVLKILGPRERARISLMPQGLGLSANEAHEVLAHGLEQGLFEVDRADPAILQATPRSVAGR